MISKFFDKSPKITFHGNTFVGTRVVFSETIMDGQRDIHKVANTPFLQLFVRR